MGRDRGTRVALQDLQTVFNRQRLDDAFAHLRAEEGDAIDIVESLQTQNLEKRARTQLGDAVYDYGKCVLDSGNIRRACHIFEIAARLSPRPLILHRHTLLRQAADFRTNAIQWRESLIEMQRALAIVCHKQHCECESHFDIAWCRGLIGRGLHHKVKSFEVHTLAAYHPYNMGHPWTRLLKRIKASHEANLLNPLIDILADFIFEETSLLRSADVVVPIPPSTEKYLNRGFAPNDIVAKGLEKRLGLIYYQVLFRNAGPPTRDVSSKDLATQFTAKRGANLSGINVLLVEDIWTKGRTIPICVEKLRVMGAASVSAVALGKTGG